MNVELKEGVSPKGGEAGKPDEFGEYFGLAETPTPTPTPGGGGYTYPPSDTDGPPNTGRPADTNPPAYTDPPETFTLPPFGTNTPGSTPAPTGGGISGPFDNLRFTLPENVFFVFYDELPDGSELREVAFVKIGNDFVWRQKQKILERDQYFFEYYKYTGSGWKVWYKNVLDYSGFTFGIDGSEPADQAVIDLSQALEPGNWVRSGEDEKPGSEGAIFLYDRLNSISELSYYSDIEGQKKWGPSLFPGGVWCDIYDVDGYRYFHDPVSNLFFQLVLGGHDTCINTWQTEGVSFSLITPDLPN